MKPLTTEPPLDPTVTEYDRIEARRFDLYKKGLLEEEQLHDSLNAEHELELEHQAMQADQDEYEWDDLQDVYW